MQRVRGERGVVRTQRPPLVGVGGQVERRLAQARRARHLRALGARGQPGDAAHATAAAARRPNQLDQRRERHHAEAAVARGVAVGRGIPPVAVAAGAGTVAAGRRGLPLDVRVALAQRDDVEASRRVGAGPVAALAQ